MNKALTVDTELARLIIAGDADVVNRFTRTTHRGRLYIHDHEMVIGTVDVIGCHPADECQDGDRLCSDFALPVRGYHWVLANARPLACPFPETGRLGIWTLGGAALTAVR